MQFQIQNQLSLFSPLALIPQPLLPILGEGVGGAESTVSCSLSQAWERFALVGFPDGLANQDRGLG
jgi:hypothetical protein